MGFVISFIKSNMSVKFLEKNNLYTNIGHNLYTNIGHKCTKRNI